MTSTGDNKNGGTIKVRLRVFQKLRAPQGLSGPPLARPSWRCLAKLCLSATETAASLQWAKRSRRSAKRRHGGNIVLGIHAAWLPNNSNPVTKSIIGDLCRTAHPISTLKYPRHGEKLSKTYPSAQPFMGEGKEFPHLSCILHFYFLFKSLH